jgi:hypothetical protein
MLNTYKKYLMMILFVLLSLGVTNGLAYGTLITLDAIKDAGLSPGQTPYLRFVDNSSGEVLYDAAQYSDFLTINPTRWPSSKEVIAFANTKANWGTAWRLESVGDFWSPGKNVGVTLDGLNAGNYRISDLIGFFQYDSFEWGSPDDQQPLWKMMIRSQWVGNAGRPVTNEYTLGPYSPSVGSLSSIHLDIPLEEGGSLSFWIPDWNSIDNSGSISFNVPEPSTFLLLTIGIALLIRRTRS